MKKYLFLFFILLFTFFLFSDSLSYSFISDDYFYINFRSVFDAVRFYPGFYHYNPVFWLTMMILTKLFGYNPYPFHLVAIILHLLNTYFVYILGNRLLGSVKKSLLSSLLFATFFANYEVVFWVTGLQTSLMVLFYLLGLMTFFRYQAEVKIRYIIYYQILFLLAIFTHEYAISLLIICLIYLQLKNRNLKLRLSFMAIPLGTLFGLFLIKKLVIHTPIVVSISSVAQFISSLIKSINYLFFPVPSVIDSLPKFSLFLSIFIISVFIWKSTRNRRQVFFLGWGMIIVILFCATSLPQARYLYLASIPIIFFILNQMKLKSAAYMTFFYLLLYLLSGILFIQQQKPHWKESSLMTDNVAAILNQQLSSGRMIKPMYFVNLPDSSNRSPWKAYAFRNGMENMINVISHGKATPVIYYYRTFQARSYTRQDPFITYEQLDRLKEDGKQIYLYNEIKKNIDLY